jgi:hypothetical protein
MKLCQIVAIEKGTKNKAQSGLTDVYQRMQKPVLLSGIARTYRPKDEEGEVFPPEQTKVQLSAVQLINDARALMSELFDVTATKDWANCGAKADVVVGGNVLVKDVPVTYLLFLEKKLVDIHTFVSKLPVLDPSETWKWDPNAGCYASEPAETHKTKKVPRVIEKAKATDKHPAQVELLQEDVVVGYWKTVKFSGALPADDVKKFLDRVEVLQRAVKFAREEANSKQIEEVKLGAKIFSYLFD